MLTEKIRRLTEERISNRWEVHYKNGCKAFLNPTILPTILTRNTTHGWYMISDGKKIYRLLPDYSSIEDSFDEENYRRRAKKLNKYTYFGKGPCRLGGLSVILAYDQDVVAVARFFAESPKNFIRYVDLKRLFDDFFHPFNIEHFVRCINGEFWKSFAATTDEQAFNAFTDAMSIGYRFFRRELIEIYGEDLVRLFPEKSAYLRKMYSH